MDGWVELTIRRHSQDDLFRDLFLRELDRHDVVGPRRNEDHERYRGD